MWYYGITQSQHCNMMIITMMTMSCVRLCCLNSLVVHFNVKTCDIWEGNVILKKIILWILECVYICIYLCIYDFWHDKLKMKVYSSNNIIFLARRGLVWTS